MKKQFKQISIFNQISIPFSKSFYSTLRKHIHLVPVLILGIQQLEKERRQIHYQKIQNGAGEPDFYLMEPGT